MGAPTELVGRKPYGTNLSQITKGIHVNLYVVLWYVVSSGISVIRLKRSRFAKAPPLTRPLSAVHCVAKDLRTSYQDDKLGFEQKAA